MTQISRRSLFGAAAAASVLPVAGGLAAFSPIAAAAAAPKKARTIVEIAAMSPIDMARKSDVVQTSYEIIRAAAGRLRDPELRKAVLSIIENPAPTIASADQSAVLASGDCVAVNPDPVLLEAARENGWLVNAWKL